MGILCVLFYLVGKTTILGIIEGIFEIGISRKYEEI